MTKNKEARRLESFLRAAYALLSTPLAIVYLTYSRRVNPDYNMPWWRRMLLGLRFCINHRRVQSGTSWRAHLLMAMKILELGPNVKGDIVECGCWKGGATVNLSLVCAITGRKLRVYDSFQGMPPPQEGDPVAARTFQAGYVPGVLEGTLDEVRGNVEKYGALGACSFHPGWFADTLPNHDSDIALMFLDVDFHSSMHDCLQNLWPRLIDKGYVFIDEYLNLGYCAVFYSEKYWRKYFSQDPPGLAGAGTGVQLGMLFTDPVLRGRATIQGPAQSIAFAVKGARSVWEYYPDEAPRAAPGAATDSH